MLSMLWQFILLFQAISGQRNLEQLNWIFFSIMTEIAITVILLGNKLRSK